MLGSVGPGTKLPTLGHVTFATLRDAYDEQVRGMLDGGVDAVLVETSQDLLQTKAAVIGARRAIDVARQAEPVPLIVNVTVETTGTMLLGSEIGAALTALEPLGIDLIGLNCATGPTEMSEHLRYLSRHARVALGVHAQRGLPELTSDGAVLPADPGESWPTRTRPSSASTGCPWSAAAAVRRRSTSARSSTGSAAASAGARRPRTEPGASSLYQHVPFRQDTSYLSIGERTNANGSKAFRERDAGGALGRLRRDRPGPDPRRCTPARPVRRLRRPRRRRRHAGDGASRLATSSTLPIVLDSTEPELIEAGLEALAGRCVINSVNYEDGDGPDVALRPGDADRQGARRGRGRADDRRGGSGPDRRLEGRDRRAPDRGPHRQLGARR